MRRTTALLAACLSLALLAGCGKPAPEPTPTPVVTATPAPEVPDTPHMTRDAFPTLDGSTSTAPLARAVCAVLLGEDRDAVAGLGTSPRPPRLTAT